MPQHRHARIRVCHHCDGFASAVIATGSRHLDGTRRTIPVACPACRGLGTLAHPLVTAKAV
ncbi:hypothetical protein ACGFX4_40955 [Kitasatospora sp. NPDC048365]|uniref:hypothetical protein n=1 Tax=Kitasatospora sp. NPDC048365 TaxID=3364050 RepID=UPI00371BC577